MPSGEEEQIRPTPFAAVCGKEKTKKTHCMSVSMKQCYGPQYLALVREIKQRTEDQEVVDKQRERAAREGSSLQANAMNGQITIVHAATNDPILDAATHNFIIEPHFAKEPLHMKISKNVWLEAQRTVLINLHLIAFIGMKNGRHYSRTCKLHWYMDKKVVDQHAKSELEWWFDRQREMLEASYWNQHWIQSLQRRASRLLKLKKQTVAKFLKMKNEQTRDRKSKRNSRPNNAANEQSSPRTPEYSREN